MSITGRRNHVLLEGLPVAELLQPSKIQSCYNLKIWDFRVCFKKESLYFEYPVKKAKIEKKYTISLNVYSLWRLDRNFLSTTSLTWKHHSLWYSTKDFFAKGDTLNIVTFMPLAAGLSDSRGDDFPSKKKRVTTHLKITQMSSASITKLPIRDDDMQGKLGRGSHHRREVFCWKWKENLKKIQILFFFNFH